MKIQSRRSFLASAAATIPVAATAAVAPEVAGGEPVFISCPQAKGGPNAARFPRVIVQDQHKRKAWFYEEFVDGKLVLVSFTSVKGEKQYPVLDNLVKVQDILQDRLGKDVFMYTVTTDPYRDGADELRALADKHGARWRFLSGEAASIQEILVSFNVRGILNALTWIGNEQTGRWIKRPSRQTPLAIAEAVARLSVGKEHKPFLVDRHSANGRHPMAIAREHAALRKAAEQKREVRDL
jgi:protein SCO1